MLSQVRKHRNKTLWANASEAKRVRDIDLRARRVEAKHEASEVQQRHHSRGAPP